MVRYYKTEADAGAGKEALGEIDAAGATLFLKEVGKGGVHRFTLLAASRALKLRAPKVDYERWTSALRAYVKEIAEDDELDTSRSRGVTMGGDDDDSD